MNATAPPDALQLATIATAALGQLSPTDLDRVPCEALTGAPRLFAWTCASRSCRVLGRRSSFLAARHCLAAAPRLELPLEVWRRLIRDTEAELGAAERVGPRVRVVDLLLAGGPP